jgi:hypothetical protein
MKHSRRKNMQITLVALFLFQTLQVTPLLENDFVQVFRNSAPCASAAAACGERVVVALGSIDLNDQKMERGDVKVFKTGERYSAPKSGDYLEVAIKPVHPRVILARVQTPPPPDNKVLYDDNQFVIFEENLNPGETSALHSHNQRLAVFLNATQVQQWTDGKSEVRDLVPDLVTFRDAVVHVSKDVGKIPIRNILIEFKP